jgi:hypothetical protein
MSRPLRQHRPIVSRSTRQDRTTHPTRPINLGRPGHATTRRHRVKDDSSIAYLAAGLLRARSPTPHGIPASAPPGTKFNNSRAIKTGPSQQRDTVAPPTGLVRRGAARSQRCRSGPRSWAPSGRATSWVTYGYPSLTGLLEWYEKGSTCRTTTSRSVIACGAPPGRLPLARRSATSSPT